MSRSRSARACPLRRERVRGALNAIGLALLLKRITVNLAPADLPKKGSHYDLPIALGVMAAMGAVAPDAIENYFVLGELALDGSIARIAGKLPATLREAGIWPLFCPIGGSAELALKSTGKRASSDSYGTNAALRRPQPVI